MNFFMNKLKQAPKFKSEKEEAEFWATHDTSKFFRIDKPFVMDFPDLKPTTKTITLRISVSLLHRIKKIANKKDMPYQSLMKVFLDEKARQELKTV